jgi:hypothetical protein
MITIDEFEGSFSHASPAKALDLALQALWWSGKGDWARAHDCVQQAEGTQRCDHVHAFLHRQEGDLGNARYWYRRAGEPVPTEPLPAEFKAIAVRLLDTMPAAGSPPASGATP